MKGLSLQNIARVTGGTLYGADGVMDREVTQITSDSRKVTEDCLFVAIAGERVDGHSFIPQVMEAGALCSIGEKVPEPGCGPFIKVDSSLQAVKDIAAFYLEELQIPVVGISGSVGKTSTKEMVASVLKQKYRTLKTEGNFNNELGLPLTVFRLRDEDQIAVLEMGISDFGEMTRLARIARPDTALITNIGTCHLEFLGDRDGVFRAKTEMLDFVRPEGHIVLNGDDDKLIRVKEHNGIRPVFYGLDPSNDVYADEIENLGLKGMKCRIHLDAENFSVTIPMPGIHMVMNALAGAAVGRIYGLSAEEIRRGIESIEPLQGRFHMIETERFLVIDDCYNASPATMKGSLDVLSTANGRKVAILGDMGELGENAPEMHREVGRHAAMSGLDLLICVGELSSHMAEAARQSGGPEVILEPDLTSLLSHLTGYVQNGDNILVKASHFMKFPEVVKKLTEM
ncbi:MAG: UDP-N-acetylmuramoyl-tripeptide--D-alanyl-D-alanine ligase [Blautia sp.]|nr:UDP-N-acetylmuramoyl-tripeptide--D-alanyl-D-alanine ligase [Blautia sp.]